MFDVLFDIILPLLLAVDLTLSLQYLLTNVLTCLVISYLTFIPTSFEVPSDILFDISSGITSDTWLVNF